MDFMTKRKVGPMAECQMGPTTKFKVRPIVERQIGRRAEYQVCLISDESQDQVVGMSHVRKCHGRKSDFRT
jgi:hypothetical protein